MDNDLDNAPAYNYSSLEDLNKLIASDADLDHNFESTLQQQRYIEAMRMREREESLGGHRSNSSSKGRTVKFYD